MDLGKVCPAPPDVSCEGVSQRNEGVEKVKIDFFLMKKTGYHLKILDTLAATVAVITIIIEYSEDAEFYGAELVETDENAGILQEGNRSSNTTQTLRSINICLTAVLFVAICCRHLLYRKLIRIEKKSRTVCGWKSGLVLIGELAICAVVSPNGLNATFTGEMLGGKYEYSWDSVFFTLMLPRVYLLIRLFSHFSIWNSKKALRTGQLLHVKPGLSFILKAEFKARPYRMITGLMLGCVAILGTALRVYERSYYGSKQCAVDLRYETNSMWTTIITMTTVGYGDGYPSTHLGRLVSTLGCFIGMVLITLMILSLTIQSSLTPQEFKAYKKLTQLKTREDIKSKASDVIKSVLRLCKAQTDSGNKVALCFIWIVKLRRCIRLFTDRNRVDTADDYPAEEVLERLRGKFKRDLRELKTISGECRDVRQRCDKLVEREESLERRMTETSKTQAEAARLLLVLHNAVAAKRLQFRTMVR